MENPVRLPLAVGGGYVLGRTNKLKLALTLGSLVLGKKLPSANMLLAQGVDFLRANPEAAELRRKLVGAGKTAAIAAASNGLKQATRSVGDRADAISGKRAPAAVQRPAAASPSTPPSPEPEQPQGHAEAVGPDAWQSLTETTRLARALREQQDKEQMQILLRDTDGWFADRLPPAPDVAAMATELSGFAQWAGMDYRLVEMLDGRAPAGRTSA